MAPGTYTLRFWGARGTVPTPEPGHLRYGGHTACLSVALGGDELLILDCGSGMRPLGQELARSDGPAPRRFRVLLSHYHFDHLEGLPFFPPLYDPRSSFTFYGFAPDGSTVQGALEGFVRPPYFPVSLAGAPARRDYVSVGRDPLELTGDLLARSLPLNHPDGSLAWSLERGGSRVVYATDHEHGDAEIDRALERFCEGARLLIYDATYIPSEYETLRRGWGHSTWYAGVALARAARVEKLVLFHHHPDHTDEQIDRLMEAARGDFPSADAGREGMEFTF